MNESALNNETWHPVCSTADLTPDGGVCALVGGHQIAIFQDSIEKSLYAVSNYDPIGKANVMSRGIVGSIKGSPVVASPLYKQHFDLQTGHCVEMPEFSLRVFGVRIQNDEVMICL